MYNEVIVGVCIMKSDSRCMYNEVIVVLTEVLLAVLTYVCMFTFLHSTMGLIVFPKLPGIYVVSWASSLICVFNITS